jgi:exodeoxyribonuclease VII small subunit
MASPKKGTRQPGFEEALARLEKIVKSLEDGDLPLEDSLRLFEEGVSLTRLCAARLEEAQKRIDVLTRNDQGDSKLVPFEPSRGDEEGGPEAP